MSHNGKDTSGNALKYSLIPLFLGIVLIFFLYRNCGDMVHEPQPKTTSTEVVETEEMVSEQPNVEESVESTEEPADSTVENDTIDKAE